MSTIKVTLPSGTHHFLETLGDGTPDYSAYSSSINTRNALQAAYDSGDWEPYTAPEPEPAPPEPNPALFRAALAQTESWLQWAETLPSVGYTNLTIAAANSNWAEAQLIYDRLIDNSLPPTGAATEWQALADANGIPITF